MKLFALLGLISVATASAYAAGTTLTLQADSQQNKAPQSAHRNVTMPSEAGIRTSFVQWVDSDFQKGRPRGLNLGI